jgi:hypothetical protein
VPKVLFCFSGGEDLEDQKLSELERQIIQQMDTDSEIEKEIEETSLEIASQLIVSNKVNTMINKTNYLFAYRLLDNGKQKKIFMLVTDIFKYNLVGTQYKPFTVTADVDQRYDLCANLKTAVEGFIRHITGRFKPEIVEDQD